MSDNNDKVKIEVYQNVERDTISYTLIIPLSDITNETMSLRLQEAMKEASESGNISHALHVLGELVANIQRSRNG